jgi:glycosyltransferase involved in cell wall biosynthesis
MQQTGLSGDRVTSIPTGIDLAQFQPLDITPSQGNLAQQALRQRLGLPADRFIIGIVATLRSWKGHRYLVEAMQSLLSGSSNATAQRPYLLIVGDGPGREPLGTQIQALGLQQSVQMVGNQQDVVPWLQCLDVFALPSYANEGVSSLLLPPVRETKDASRGGKDLIHQIDQYCSERDHARSRIGLACNRLQSNEQKCVV